jgi:hypothetical protein
MIPIFTWIMELSSGLREMVLCLTQSPFSHFSGKDLDEKKYIPITARGDP